MKALTPQGREYVNALLSTLRSAYTERLPYRSLPPALNDANGKTDKHEAIQEKIDIITEAIDQKIRSLRKAKNLFVAPLLQQKKKLDPNIPIPQNKEVRSWMRYWIIEHLNEGTDLPLDGPSLLRQYVTELHAGWTPTQPKELFK